MTSHSTSLYSAIVQKMEYYCSYQERCHVEVTQKLYAFELTASQRDEVIVHLIDSNFLNEERFAKLFSISKFHQKKWGNKRIANELKQRHISDYLIRMGLKEIPAEEYETTFADLAEKTWTAIREKDNLKKRKKFCDTLLRKGWESDLIYAKVKELETA